MKETIYDITIIGAGPVGLFTAFYASLRQAKVKVIESLAQPGGQPAYLYPEKLIYDIPAYPSISGEALRDQLLKQLARFEPSLVFNEEVLALKEQTDSDGKAYFEIMTNQATHASRTVIIAAGNGAFSPRKLSLDNADDFEGGNLHYYINNIEQFTDRVVAVCGGGDSAVDWALTLEPLAKKVYIIHRRQKFRALESSIAQLEASSVEIMTPYVPTHIEGNNGVIDALVINKARTDHFQTLEVDDIIVNYGFTSSIGEIRHWDLALERNKLVVDQHMQTSRPGIYAVGDIATYPGKVDIIASGFGEAPQAVNNALVYMDPEHIQPHMHSTSLF